MAISSFNHNFDNFKIVPGTEESYNTLKDFVITSKPILILIIGGVGSGKTYLLEATAIQWRVLGRFSRVLKYERILAGLKMGMMDRAIPNYEIRLQNLLNSERLLIDDYGMGSKDSEWSKSILETVVDHRYHERLPTVITTNIDVTELPQRVYSRFCDKELAKIIINRGKDYRKL